MGNWTRVMRRTGWWREYLEVERGCRLDEREGMKLLYVICAALVPAGWLSAQDKIPPVGEATATNEAMLATLLAKAEPFLLLPEPREMRVGHSIVLGGAKHTVFTPVRHVAGKPGVEAYSKAEFAKLGISPDTFAERARAAADRILASLQPELMKDDAGRVRYAVYRGEAPVFACLLVAPSLGTVFQNVFGKEIWLAAPDRNALYVFPPNPAVVDDFSGDLQQRFESDAYAASEEVFVLSAKGGELKAVATFRDR